jgi:hypothetical protein
MTRKETVRSLCKHLVTKLENQHQIEFAPRVRQEVWESLYQKIGSAVLSDEDLKERVVEKLHLKADALSEMAMTESDQYKSTMRMIREQFGENVLNGLYYQKPVRAVAQDVVSFLMNTPQVDEVFESDEVLVKNLVDLMQRFKPEELH